MVFSLGGASGADSTAPVTAINGQMPGLTLKKDFPGIKLRGYGELAGKYWADGTGGSLVEIDCQDAEHARLVQAKYLSDLGELPPATQPGQIDVGGVKISIQSAEDVGSVAALRNGTTVVLAAAKSPDALAQLLTGGLTGDRAQWTSTAEGKVPMFLDRFDKYGFRFYYAPGNLKPGPNGRGMPDYDPREDFNFAEACNHAGIVVWSGGQDGMSAEGLTNDPHWAWALGEAKEKGLPFGVNLGIGATSAFWYYNRDPESLVPYSPDFLGTYYGSMNFGIRPMVLWTSPEGQDAMLGQLQNTVRRYADVDNITSWLEPHQELGGGDANLMVDYGPGADANYRDYLREKYQTIGALSQRWYGNATGLTSWDDVKAPEVADFLGWNADAIDLAGLWRISYADANNPAATAPDFNDSAWGQTPGPGHDLDRALPQKPALWRRHVTLDPNWRTKHPKVWLYVWDMNDTRWARKDPTQAVVVTLNGKVLPENPPVIQPSHWIALDVTDVLQNGDNVFAIRLPRGLFNYRVYLSGDEPKSYPDLGPGKNAQWVDFSDWLSYLRQMGVRRGMQMIRQVDPNRGIMLMAPDVYEDGIQQDAIEYGGDFHNTGYMGGWWCDKLPALMRGAGLPFSVEPSQGPTLPAHLLGGFGNWIPEGCNAIDYFQNMGEVLWNPAVKQCFEDHLPLYTSVGRYHCPTAQVAALYSNRLNNLLGFPWLGHSTDDHGQPFFRSGSYPSSFNSRGIFSPVEHVPDGTAYESDAVTEMMFEHDQVGKYRVVVDTDTAIMDEDTLNGIERFVRAGGVFVTYGETGRHSPEVPDSWPIDRLTGFHVTSLVPIAGSVGLADQQKVFPTNWVFDGNQAGHGLTAVAPEAQSLMMWNNGSTAVGLRPLGKGYVVTVGPWFNGKIGNEFFSNLFQWLKIDPIPAHYEEQGPGPEVFWRHFLSNNDLYDVWVVRNNNGKDRSAQGTLILADGYRPAWAVDLNTGKRSPVTDGRLPVNLPIGEMAMYITPRPEIASSPADWFDLQRDWWQGTADPGLPLPKAGMKLTLDLTDGWLLQPVDAAQSDVSALVAPATDDHAWPSMRLGILSLPDHPDMRHAVVRKHFRTPDAWNHGRIFLCLPSFQDGGQAYLDGQLLTTTTPLAPGVNHVVAVDIHSHGFLLGGKGSAWLMYLPDPLSKQDIGGNWETSSDSMNWSAPISLPGQVPQGVRLLRRMVPVDQAAAGKTVVVHVVQSGSIGGVIVNGNSVSPWSRENPELDLNVTPWIKPGQTNEIILTTGGKETASEVSLEFFQPGTYP